jgi:hypothetical protein
LPTSPFGRIQDNRLQRECVPAVTELDVAAVVARQLNKVCIVGCRELAVQSTGVGCRIGDQIIEKGAAVSLDGHSGRIYAGKLEVVEERPTSYLREIECWRARLREPPAGTFLAPDRRVPTPIPPLAPESS